MGNDPARLQVLEVDECVRRLTEHVPQIGRVAFVLDGGLSVLPVNYAMHKGTIVLRTKAGGALDAGASQGPVAFEVDELDPTWQEGWSVLVKGTCAAVTGGAEAAELRRLRLQQWATSDGLRYLRIVPDEISGRQLL